MTRELPEVNEVRGAIQGDVAHGPERLEAFLVHGIEHGRDAVVVHPVTVQPRGRMVETPRRIDLLIQRLGQGPKREKHVT